MTIWILISRQMWSALQRIILLALCMSWLVPTIMAAEPQVVTVDISSRVFIPHRAILHHGQPTVLVVRNHDSELHAFVPSELFAGVNLNVTGNGAPEFGEQGFKRAIIPPEGSVEIHFTPEQAGEFSYVCDMPGHQMAAMIVVE
jgi:uncharacterized cupredoxin-like copper-binding protein